MTAGDASPTLERVAGVPRGGPKNVRFLRVLEDEDKGRALLELARKPDLGRCFDRSREQLAEVPGTPFGYWLSSSVRALFLGAATYSGCGGMVWRHSKQGLATSNDFRFIRSWFEVRPDPTRWRPIAKGRNRDPMYSDIPEVITWEAEGDPGRELKAYVMTKPGNKHWSRRVVGVDFYGRPGFSWPVRASRFSPRALPAGTVFSHRGYSAFTDAKDDLMALVGWGSSSIVDFMFKASLGRFGFPEFLVGVLKAIPFPGCDPIQDAQLSALAQRSWRIRRSLDTAVETSRAFTLPAVLQVDGGTFRERVGVWLQNLAAAEAEITEVQLAVDKLCFDLYGVDENDRIAVNRGFDVADLAEDEDDGEPEDRPDRVPGSAPRDFAEGLVSWAVGVAFGRFDVRLATGEMGLPAAPGPFDELPYLSTAMLATDTGAAGGPSPRYPVKTAPILAEDAGHELDLTTYVRAVFSVVFGENADGWWADVGAALDARDGIDGWLRRGFFAYHLDRYSKPSRKAPIYWPIGTRSGSCRIWLYAHGVDKDTLFQVISDIVEPKLASERRRLDDLRQEAGPSPSASQRRAIEQKQALIDELSGLREEMSAVAPLWAPCLDDGIVVGLAPFWRLFAHHRDWASELKGQWKRLGSGEYDWSQLAMHIWPERVIPACLEDRSLAIAHRLEDSFWTQDEVDPDKWEPSEVPSELVERLVIDRLNPSITAARTHPNP